MTFITFFAVALLFIVIPFTRLFGVVGLMLLLYFQTYATTGVLLLMGAFYFIYWR